MLRNVSYKYLEDLFKIYSSTIYLENKYNLNLNTDSSWNHLYIICKSDVKSSTNYHKFDIKSSKITINLTPNQRPIKLPQISIQINKTKTRGTYQKSREKFQNKNHDMTL